MGCLACLSNRRSKMSQITPRLKSPRFTVIIWEIFYVFPYTENLIQNCVEFLHIPDTWSELLSFSCRPWLCVEGRCGLCDFIIGSVIWEKAIHKNMRHYEIHESNLCKLHQNFGWIQRYTCTWNSSSKHYVQLQLNIYGINNSNNI